MRVRDQLRLGRYVAESIIQSEEGEIIRRTPESRFYAAIISRGLMDYWKYWKLSKKRPLNHIQRMKYSMVHDWLFIDDPSYLSLYVLTEYASDFNELLLKKIREVALTDKNRLRLWAKEFFGDI